jgi:hypothetical protein
MNTRQLRKREKRTQEGEETKETHQYDDPLIMPCCFPVHKALIIPKEPRTRSKRRRTTTTEEEEGECEGSSTPSYSVDFFLFALYGKIGVSHTNDGFTGSRPPDM